MFWIARLHHFVEFMSPDGMLMNESAPSDGNFMTGMSVMPQCGHLPGLSECTSLCSGMGQV
jgi:hypothetical protein